MKAITVCQPFAWAMFHAKTPKRIENRTWRTYYRGAVAIHAGTSRKWLNLSGGVLADGTVEPHRSAMHFGAIVGVATIVDCAEAWKVRVYAKDWKLDPTELVWAVGPWCWLLRKAVAIDPIPCRGALGLWEPREELVKQIEAAIPGPKP